MSNHAWERRRVRKRLRILIRRAVRILNDNPYVVVPLSGTDMVAIGYDRYCELAAVVEQRRAELASTR